MSAPLYKYKMQDPGQFSLVFHDFPNSHWDWFFEEKEALKTYHLDTYPEIPHQGTMRLGKPHRKMYLDYEGPVRGDRGTVTKIMSGVYRLVEETQDQRILKVETSQGFFFLIVAQLNKKSVKYRLKGKGVAALFPALVATKNVAHLLASSQKF